MDISFVDLDVALGRVRDARSRKYLQDAVKAYRAGALRPAVTATWVATAFDLISKIKELSEAGDQEATRIWNDWDTNRTAENTARLVQLERELLDEASGILQLLTPVDVRQIRRLQEDRHLCAHPAFSSEAELFEPTPELTRLHIVNAVELVLSQRPVQGRTILEQFSADVVSPGFPSSLQRIADYFERQYIERTRPSVLMNLAIVIAKGILRDTPPEWRSVQHKLSRCLRAIQDRRPAEWPTIQTAIVRLIDEMNPDDRYRSFRIIGMIPGLYDQLAEPTKVALLESIEAAAHEPPFDLSFVFAENIPALRPTIERVVARFERQELEDAIAMGAPLILWVPALDRLANSGGFRTAEDRFENLISPFAGLVGREAAENLLATITGNGQIYYASGVPGLLEAFITAQPEECMPSEQSWDEFYRGVTGYRRQYEDIWTLLERRGWNRPPLAEGDRED